MKIYIIAEFAKSDSYLDVVYFNNIEVFKDKDSAIKKLRELNQFGNYGIREIYIKEV